LQTGDNFRSFANPEISGVGAELDHKLAVLLAHLGLDALIAGLAGSRA
jgi:hypothetical protein